MADAVELRYHAASASASSLLASASTALLGPALTSLLGGLSSRLLSGGDGGGRAPPPPTQPSAWWPLPAAQQPDVPQTASPLQPAPQPPLTQPAATPPGGLWSLLRSLQLPPRAGAELEAAGLRSSPDAAVPSAGSGGQTQPGGRMMALLGSMLESYAQRSSLSNRTASGSPFVVGSLGS